MSWSDQQTTNENNNQQNQQEIEQLRRNYADAELAYQSLKRVLLQSFKINRIFQILSNSYAVVPSN